MHSITITRIKSQRLCIFFDENSFILHIDLLQIISKPKKEALLGLKLFDKKQSYFLLLTSYKFGGMNKANMKKGKQKNTLYNYFKKEIVEDKNIIQTVRKFEKKEKLYRKIPENISLQERSSSLPIFIKKNSLFSFAKEVSIEELFSKCPKLLVISTQIEETVNFQKTLVRKILKKYIQSNSHSLWSSKYAPNDSSELFNTNAGQKIRDWFEAFFQYKNKISSFYDPYLDDFEEQKSCKIYKKIRQNGWNLDALIIRGRPGIGKSSAIKAIARQLEIDWQECGNHFNPTKYLKEKNQSTQSESVKTAITRKLKLQKNAQMITKYIPSIEKAEREKTNQAMKCQIIHHVGSIYPQSDANKFYAELNRCIQLSKIPFVMTDAGERLPFQCQKYDQIEYQVGQESYLQQFLWIIYHIERLLMMDTTKMIQKQDLFAEINKQIEQTQFRYLIPLQKIKHICCIFNYQIDRILTILQDPNISSLNFSQQLVEKYTSLSKDYFLRYMPYLTRLQQNGFSKNFNSQQFGDKIEDITHDQKYAEKPNLHEILQIKRMAKFRALSQFEGHSKLMSHYKDQDLLIHIPEKIHKQIKQTLIKKVNNEIAKYFDQNKSSLRVSELQYFPMMIKKGLISKRTTFNEDCKKYFNENQCMYLQKYVNFIKNS